MLLCVAVAVVCCKEPKNIVHIINIVNIAGIPVLQGWCREGMGEGGRRGKQIFKEANNSSGSNTGNSNSNGTTNTCNLGAQIVMLVKKLLLWLFVVVVVVVVMFVVQLSLGQVIWWSAKFCQVWQCPQTDEDGRWQKGVMQMEIGTKMGKEGKRWEEREWERNREHSN